MVEADNGGLRFNHDKPRTDLIPAEFILALAEHCGSGAAKYSIVEGGKLIPGDWNWARGMEWGHCYAAILRHALKWQLGEEVEVDDKTGAELNHLIAIAWNAMVLYVYQRRRLGIDNRPKLGREDGVE